MLSVGVCCSSVVQPLPIVSCHTLLLINLDTKASHSDFKVDLYVTQIPKCVTPPTPANVSFCLRGPHKLSPFSLSLYRFTKQDKQQRISSTCISKLKKKYCRNIEYSLGPLYKRLTSFLQYLFHLSRGDPG